MAKKSSVNKNERRRKLVKQYAERRDTLIARKANDAWRFDIVLQGEAETVFFDV